MVHSKKNQEKPQLYLLINNKQVQMYLYKYKNVSKTKLLNISLNNLASQRT